MTLKIYIEGKKRNFLLSLSLGLLVSLSQPRPSVPTLREAIGQTGRPSSKQKPA
jgi:hypothetical protein